MSVDRGRTSSRATHRSIPRVLLALAAALTVLVAPLATVGPAVADDAADLDAVTVVAAPGEAGIVRQGTMLSVRVTVRNDTDTLIEAGEAVLSIDPAGPTTSVDLNSWFAADHSDDAELPRVATRAPVGPLEPGAVAVLDLVVGASSLGFGAEPGPRRALVEHHADGLVQGQARTAVVWLSSEAPLPTTPSALIVPITTPGIPDALLSTTQLGGLTAPSGALTRRLDAVEGHPVTFALDPRIAASIRTLGDAAPGTAIDMLARLESNANESFALRWADADPALPFVSGGTDTALPDELPQPEGSVPLDRLTDWDHEVQGVAWPSSGAVTQESLEALSDAGEQVVIAPSALVSGDQPVRQLGTNRLLVVDSALSSALADAASARSAQTFDSAVAHAAALLAAAAVDGRALIGALDRDAHSSTRLEALLDSLQALPWRLPVSTASILAAPVGSVGLEVLDGADAELVAAAGRAFAAEAADIDFARISSTPDPLVAQRRLELLAALSPGWGSQRTAALDAFVEGSNRLRSSVQIVESSTITLLTDRTSLPITVQNELAVPVTVYVSVAPATGELRVLDQQVEVSLEPDSRAQALVPVQSLTNGTVDITVSLRDADGGTIGDSTTLDLNLQAGWETAGTVAIAVIIALLFAIGVTRDIRKRRRRRERGQATPADSRTPPEASA